VLSFLTLPPNLVVLAPPVFVAAIGHLARRRATATLALDVAAPVRGAGDHVRRDCGGVDRQHRALE
jgi:hypothetical protein